MVRTYLPKDAPRCDGHALREAHGQNLALQVTKRETPLALI